MEREAYENEVCRRLNGALTIRFKPVTLQGWQPEVGKCHANVDTWVLAHPDHVAVRGWVTWMDFGISIRLTAHSIVQSPDGELFDITPLGNERDRASMRFVPHVGDDAVFFAHKDHCLSIDCPTSDR